MLATLDGITDEGRPVELTRREKDILTPIFEGFSNK